MLDEVSARIGFLGRINAHFNKNFRYLHRFSIDKPCIGSIEIAEILSLSARLHDVLELNRYCPENFKNIPRQHRDESCYCRVNLMQRWREPLYKIYLFRPATTIFDWSITVTDDATVAAQAFHELVAYDFLRGKAFSVILVRNAVPVALHQFQAAVGTRDCWYGRFAYLEPTWPRTARPLAADASAEPSDHAHAS